MDKQHKQDSFWADSTAEKLQHRGVKKAVISTGITPSGEIHVGHLREVVTAHVVSLATEKRGIETDFQYVADNLDPLRRVYPFLDETKYAAYVGKPIAYIPCPCGKHENYAEHFIEPFLASLEKLGMKPRIVRANELYETEAMADMVLAAMKGRDQIAKILHEHTGKEIADDWWPYNPLCSECGSISDTEVLGFNESKRVVNYRCACGAEGDLPIKGGGKLTWRVDWPARWKVLGVGMEPFGKDHGTRGGSYDTGKVISSKVFDNDAPEPLMYEWISLKGMGDMSSSKGNVVSIHQMLEIVPAEVLRFFILRSQPSKRLTFDPGLPLLSLIDEYDRLTEQPDSAVHDYSRVNRNEVSVGVPFKHLVIMSQICGDDLQKISSRLAATGYEVTDKDVLAQRLKLAKNWLEQFAPDSVKFTLQEKIPDAVSELTNIQKEILATLAERLAVGMTAETVHETVYEIKEEKGVTPKEVFQAIYLALLGKDQGPRVGMFLAALDLNWVKQRFQEVA